MYPHYFEYVRDKDEMNIIVRCKLCIGKKELSTSKKSTSNAKKHLEKKHCHVKLVEVHSKS